MKFRYLTFDCYGTLIDWQKGIERSLEASFGKLPVHGGALMESYAAAEKLEEADYQKYREVLRKTSLRLAEELGLKTTKDSAVRFAGSVSSWPAFPDTQAALRSLGKHGYKRYILSNVDVDLLTATIRENGLKLDGYVTAEDVGSYKPAHAHWLRFMEMTGATKDEILHVAQSVFHDIVPAGKIGIQTAWVNRYRQALPAGAEPLYIADSMEGLVSLLE
ncbi:MAG: haloacid dehalogenase type II [Thaumarchaeota archaeon]|nr:haloacid dehalogenase type II [Nitrososphaerota archaeon]